MEFFPWHNPPRTVHEDSMGIKAAMHRLAALNAKAAPNG
jgi:hypothetical protein